MCVCIYYFMCVNLFVNITMFDLYSVICFSCFYWENPSKPTGKIHFYCLRMCNRSFVGLRMRICYQSNGGSNISKHENIKLWRDFFRNCTSVSFGGQRIRIK